MSESVSVPKTAATAVKDLCCHWCTEIEHPKHARGVRCVLELVAEETKDGR